MITLLQFIKQLKSEHSSNKEVFEVLERILSFLED